MYGLYTLTSDALCIPTSLKQGRRDFSVSVGPTVWNTKEIQSQLEDANFASYETEDTAEHVLMDCKVFEEERRLR